MTAPAKRRYQQRQTPEQRSIQARLAAQSRWARATEADRLAGTAAARAGLEAKWAEAPNPEAAKRAHMTRLALKSSVARRSA